MIVRNPLAFVAAWLLPGLFAFVSPVQGAGMPEADGLDAQVVVTDLPGPNAWVRYNGRWAGGGPWRMAVFAAADDDQPLWESILVYCIEMNEHLVLGRRYGLESVAPWAQSGGVGGRQEDPDPSDDDDGWPRDPISAASAWLYLETATPGGRYHADINLWDDVQLALWVLEEELAPDAVPETARNLVDEALAAAGRGDYDGTLVGGYNLIDPQGRRAQTMLGLVPGPLPGASVSEPSLAWLVLIGVFMGYRHWKITRDVDGNETFGHRAFSACPAGIGRAGGERKIL